MDEINMKKKMLVLCDYFLPSVKAGGPVRSIDGIISCLKNDLDITVATRNHDLGDSTPYVGIKSNCLQLNNNYQIIYLSPDYIVQGIRTLLETIAFDIIYFNSFFSPKISVRTLFFLKKRGIQTTRIIIAPRGELGAGALSIKPIRKKLFLFFFKHFFPIDLIEWHAASQSEEFEIIKVIGPSAHVTVLPNIAVHSTFGHAIKHKQKDNIKLVFLSRISKKKNLHKAIETLSAVKGRATLDIYGLIEDPDYWHVCLDAIGKLPNNIQVTYRGECHPDDVVGTLNNYDLFFLPTLNENYGHAIVESLAAGTPVLISNQTPWHDLTEHNAGWEFDLSSMEQSAELIDQLIALDHNEYHSYKRGAIDYYSNNIANANLAGYYQQYFKR